MKIFKNSVTFKFIFNTLIIGGLLASCSPEKQEFQSVDITLAAEMSLLPSTVWVAESKGFFKKHKVNLTIKEFDSGRNALETMLKDPTINISTVAQTPIVFNSFHNEQYSIIATMAYSLDDIKIVARKDKGIMRVEDLRGKKIGATERSTGHYFLEGLISHYGMDLNDVNLVDINASKLSESLKAGQVDAITSWEPHITNATKSMGRDKLSVLVSPTPFRKDFFFAANSEFANKEKEGIKQFLGALIEAENYILEHPEEVQEIVTRRLKSDLSLVKRIWPSFIFEISLEQSILVNLEDEAKWAQKLSDKHSKLPNYLNLIDSHPLKEVKPFAVNIIQ